MLRLELLGKVELVRDGVRFPLSGRNAQLLSLLALHLGRSVPDDRVHELLWQHDRPARADSTLRTYATRLRRTIGSECLDRTPSGYRLLIDPADTDLVEFEQRIIGGRGHLAQGRLDQAVDELRAAIDLWAGPPWQALDGWLEADADAVRCIELRAQAEETLADCWIQLGQNDRVVAQLRSLVELEPLRERRLILLMTALYRTGRKNEALRLFHRLRERSIEESGLDLSAEAIDFEQRLLLDELPGLASASTATGSRPQASVGISADASPADGVDPPALVGRSAELSVLTAPGPGGAESGPRLSVVMGEAGVGKSQLLRAATAGRGEVHWGRCYEAETTGQYRPVAAALRSMLAGDGESDAEQGRGLPERVRSDLAILLPELGRDGDADVDTLSADRRLRMHDAAAALVAQRAGDRSTTIVVDDIHWADGPSLGLLGHIIAHCTGRDLHVIVALRDEEVERGGPVDTWLRDIRQTCPTREVPLVGLDAAAVRQLVAEAGSRLELPERRLDELATSIHRFTDGNPFFVLELADHWAARVSPSAPAGRQLLSGQVPGGILAVLGRRIGRLDPSALTCLQVVAASPSGIDYQLLARATEIDVEMLVDALDVLSAAGLVVEETGRGDVRYRCRHDLIRRAALDGLSAARRTILHHRIAMAGDELGLQPGDPRLATVAHHWWAAGRRGSPRRALATNREASAQSMARTAYEAATVQLGHAIEALDWFEPDAAGQRAELLLERARARYAAGDQAGRELDARAAFDLAARSGAADAFADMAAAALIHGGARSTYGVANPETTTLLQGALEACPVDGEPATRALLLARLAQEHYHVNAFDTALELSAEAEELARRLDDDRLLPTVFHGRAWTLNHPDGLDQRKRLSDEMVERAMASGDRESEMVGRVWRSAASIELGDIATLDLDLARLGPLSELVRIPSILFRVATLRATRAMLEGDYEQGMVLAEETNRIGLQAEPANAEHVFLAQMIAPFRDQGLLAGALPMVEEVMTRYADVPGWRCAEAFVRAEVGDLVRAQAIVAGLAPGDFGAIPRDLAWMRAQAYLVETVAALGDAGLARILYRSLAPYAGRNVGLWDIEAAGAVTGYLGLAARTFGDLDAACRHLEDAVAFNDRTLQHSPALWARLWLADVYDRRGMPERAASLRDTVRRRSTPSGWAALHAAADVAGSGVG